MNANSLATNALVTVFVLMLVFLLPWADRRVCRKLGLNLQGGVSENKNAEKLLRIRQALLSAAFAVYLLAVAYLVFFSRAAAREYTVHAALFEDLKRAVQIDFGFLEMLGVLFTQGPKAAASHIRVITPSGITQVYMNILLFVPMGYLLPYVFPWFRAKARLRPPLVCFLSSLLIENIQLITRRGFYDLDDLVSNTIGGIIGAALFRAVAYVVTHPNWRRERKSFHRWRRIARRSTLYSFGRWMGLSRSALLATSEEAVWDFYVMKLGFRLVKQTVPPDEAGTDLFLSLGRAQLVFHCLNEQRELPPQEVTLTARHLNPVRQRLKKSGIDPGEVTQDPYTALRCLRFPAPDGVTVTIIEQ